MEKQPTSENGNGNSAKIWLKLPWEQRPLPVYFGAIRWGKHCIVKAFFTDPKRTPLEFAGPPADFADALRELADKIEGQTVDRWTAPEVDRWTAPEVDEGPPAPPRQPSGITQEDTMNGDPWHDYPLIARRFPWLADVLPAQYLKAQPRPVDQLSQDVAKLLPKVKELRKKNGEWNQLAIAGALGLPGTGGSYRPRILDVMAALDRELERRAA